MIKAQIFGVNFSASFWFFAVAGLFAVLCPAALMPYLALPVLLHELGHLAAMALVNTGIRTVRLTAFGIEIKRDPTPERGVLRELFICLSGPAANLLCAAAMYLFTFQSMRHMTMTAANIAVAAFNLLPVGGLDGGEAAKIICGYFFMPRLAYNISRVCEFLAMIPLFAAGIFLLSQPERNFTLLLACIYLLLNIMLRD